MAAHCLQPRCAKQGLKSNGNTRATPTAHLHHRRCLAQQALEAQLLHRAARRQALHLILEQGQAERLVPLARLVLRRGCLAVQRCTSCCRRLSLAEGSRCIRPPLLHCRSGLEKMGSRKESGEPRMSGPQEQVQAPTATCTGIKSTRHLHS